MVRTMRRDTGRCLTAVLLLSAAFAVAGSGAAPTPPHDLDADAALDNVENWLAEHPDRTVHVLAAADANVTAAEGHHNTQSRVLLFIFATVIVGVYGIELLCYVPLPYTVFMFLCGAAVGVGGRYSQILDDYTAISEIDPHLLLHAFLPVLIFESAFSLDVHTFGKVVGHCLTLAGPGLCLSSLALGSFAKYAFDYEWSWAVSLLFGCVLSATDPVAVVALLKDLGADPLISSLIEGESLLNDGSAIVFYVILLDTAKDDALAPAHELVLTFVRISLGGPVLGVVAGFATVSYLNGVFNSPVREIGAVLSTAYAVFYIAESVLHVSGVLALVLYGLYLSWRRSAISPEVEHLHHEFWHIVVWLANTIIFALAGVVVAKKAIGSHISGVDYARLLALYAMCVLVRSAVVFLFLPALSRLAYSLDSRNGALVAWGGLRGAVGLALALAIATETDQNLPFDRVGGRILFHVSGIVVLTLCVNGVTTTKIVDLLGLNKISHSRKVLMRAAFQKIVYEQENRLQVLAQHPFLCGADWDTVRGFTTDAPNMVDPFAAKATIEDDATCMVDDEEDARKMYLKALKSAMWTQHEEGVLLSSALNTLVMLCDEVMDQPGEILKCDCVAEYLHVPRSMKAVTQMPGVRMFRSRLLDQRVSLGYEIALGYVAAQESAQAHVPLVVPNAELAKGLQRRAEHERVAMLHKLHHFSQEFPGISRSLRTRLASRNVLNHSRAVVAEILKGGLLETNDAAVLTRRIETNMQRLVGLGASLPVPAPLARFRQSQWLKQVRDASDDCAEAILRIASEVCYDRDAVVLDHGEPHVALIHVYDGVLRLESQDYLQHVGAHGVLIDADVMRGKPSLYRVVAETEVCAVVVTLEDLRDVWSVYPLLHKMMWKKVAVKVASAVLGQQTPYSRWTVFEITHYCESGELFTHKSVRSPAQAWEGKGGLSTSPHAASFGRLPRHAAALYALREKRPLEKTSASSSMKSLKEVADLDPWSPSPPKEGRAKYGLPRRRTLVHGEISASVWQNENLREFVFVLVAGRVTCSENEVDYLAPCVLPEKDVFEVKGGEAVVLCIPPHDELALRLAPLLRHESAHHIPVFRKSVAPSDTSDSVDGAWVEKVDLGALERSSHRDSNGSVHSIVSHLSFRSPVGRHGEVASSLQLPGGVGGAVRDSRRSVSKSSPGSPLRKLHKGMSSSVQLLHPSPAAGPRSSPHYHEQSLVTVGSGGQNSPGNSCRKNRASSIQELITEPSEDPGDGVAQAPELHCPETSETPESPI